MKRGILGLLTFIFLGLGSAVAQNERAVVFLDNGTSMSGLGRIKNDYTLKFKRKSEDPAMIVSFDSIDKVLFKSGKHWVTYKLCDVKGKSRPEVLKEITSGAISMYQSSTVSYVSTTPRLGNEGLGQGGIHSTPTLEISYYIKKRDAYEVTKIPSKQLKRKNIQAFIKNYMGDCEALLNEFKNKKIRHGGIVEVVEYYNTNCAKE